MFDEKFSKRKISKIWKMKLEKKHVIHVKSCTITQSIRIVTLVGFKESYDAVNPRKGFQITKLVNLEISFGKKVGNTISTLELQTYLEKLALSPILRSSWKRYFQFKTVYYFRHANFQVKNEFSKLKAMFRS